MAVVFDCTFAKINNSPAIFHFYPLFAIFRLHFLFMPSSDWCEWGKMHREGQQQKSEMSNIQKTKNVQSEESVPCTNGNIHAFLKNSCKLQMHFSTEQSEHYQGYWCALTTKWWETKMREWKWKKTKINIFRKLVNWICKGAERWKKWMVKMCAFASGEEVGERECGESLWMDGGCGCGWLVD